MIPKPQNPTEEFFINVVRGFFKRIAGGDWEGAFSMLDLPPVHGEPFTPERFRHEVEVENFGEDTVFREEHPEGVIYSDPDTIGPSKYADVYAPRPITSGDGEAERDRCIREGRSLEVEHPVPLNGSWSDLTAHFDFIAQGNSYALRLDWLHVL
jgi:hypothetical protein